MPVYKNYIVSDYKILLGKPIIKGTRLSVEFILKKLSEGATIKKLSESYNIEIEKIYAALNYASERLADREDSITI